MKKPVAPYTAKYKYRCMKNQNFRNLGDHPLQRHDHAIATDNRKVYLYGGCWTNIVRKKMWCYHIDENRWTSMASQGQKPFSLRCHTMVYYSGHLYIFGGNFSAYPITPFWKYNIAQELWSECTPTTAALAPSGRSGHTCSVHRQSMFLFAGLKDMARVTDELWRYDFDDHCWQLENKDCGPSARQRHSSISHAGALWIYGGVGDKGCMFNDLWKWSYELRYWKKVVACKRDTDSIAPCLYSHSSSLIDHSMFLFGGIGEDELPNQTIWIFDLDRCKWSSCQMNASHCSSGPLSPISQHVSVAFRNVRSTHNSPVSITCRPAVFECATSATSPSRPACPSPQPPMFKRVSRRHLTAGGAGAGGGSGGEQPTFLPYSSGGSSGSGGSDGAGASRNWATSCLRGSSTGSARRTRGTAGGGGGGRGRGIAGKSTRGADIDMNPHELLIVEDVDDDSGFCCYLEDDDEVDDRYDASVVNCHSNNNYHDNDDDDERNDYKNGEVDDNWLDNSGYWQETSFIRLPDASALTASQRRSANPLAVEEHDGDGSRILGEVDTEFSEDPRANFPGESRESGYSSTMDKPQLPTISSKPRVNCTSETRALDGDDSDSDGDGEFNCLSVLLLGGKHDGQLGSSCDAMITTSLHIYLT